MQPDRMQCHREAQPKDPLLDPKAEQV